MRYNFFVLVNFCLFVLAFNLCCLSKSFATPHYYKTKSYKIKSYKLKRPYVWAHERDIKRSRRVNLDSSSVEDLERPRETCDLPAEFATYIPIVNESDLQSINNGLEGNYFLCRSIRLSNEFKPIAGVSSGNKISGFTGIFEGNGQSISGLNIKNSTSSQSLGLFGAVGPKGIIRNLNIIDPILIGDNAPAVGAAAGINFGLISNVRVLGSAIRFPQDGSVPQGISTVAGRYNVGGLVGQNSNGVIEHSEVSGALDVAGAAVIGGLVGANLNSVISDSHVVSDSVLVRRYKFQGSLVGFSIGGLVGRSIIDSRLTVLTEPAILRSSASATVSGYSSLGGLVGEVRDGLISDSSSTGIVREESPMNRRSSIYTDAGGLVGSSGHTSITRCFSAVEVSAVGDVGGLIGSIDGFGSQGRTGAPDLVTESFASGNVSGDKFVGGVVGSLFTSAGAISIKNVYSISSIGSLLGTKSNIGQGGTGGIVGAILQGSSLNLQFSYFSGTIPEEIPQHGPITSLYQNSQLRITAADSFYDSTKNSTPDISVGEGKTTSQLYNIETYRPNWSISDITENKNTTWIIDNLNNYPQLNLNVN